MISKKKFYIVITVFLIGIIGLVFYIYDGFELFSSDNIDTKKPLSYYNFKRFSNSFNFERLPYSVELKTFQMETKGLKLLDTNFALNFIEKSYNKDMQESNFSNYNYYAAAKFNFYDDLIGYLIMKTQITGKFYAKYIMKLYNNEGEYKGQLFLAEYFGDCKYLTVKEAKLYPGAMVTLSEKGVVFDNNCDSISSIISINSKDYQIQPDGKIIQLSK